MAVSTSEDSDVLSEINITPLVDVMLVLLVAFVITIPALTNAIHVNLPRTVQTTPPEQQKAITVTVDTDRCGVYFDDALVAPGGARAAPAATSRPPLPSPRCICAPTSACRTARSPRSWRRSSTPESPRSRYSQTTNRRAVRVLPPAKRVAVLQACLRITFQLTTW